MSLTLVKNPVRVIPREYAVKHLENSGGIIRVVIITEDGDLSSVFNVNDLLYIDNIAFKGFAKITSTGYATSFYIYTDVVANFTVNQLGGTCKNTTSSPKGYELQDIRANVDVLRIVIDAKYGNVTGNFTIGETLYLNHEAFIGAVTITAVGFPGSTTTIDTTEPYTDTSIQGGYILNPNEQLKANVIAGLSQIPYEFLRQDYQIQTTGYRLEYVEAYLPEGSGDLSSSFNVGDLIYLKTPIFDFVRTILEIVYYVGSDRVGLLLNELYTESSGGGYLNNLTSRSDYKVLVTIINDESGEVIINRDFPYNVDNAGRLFLDIVDFVEPIFAANFNPRIRLRYKEYYDGVIQNSVDDEGLLLAIAKKQLLDIGGSAMWENLLSYEPKGKMLTKFLNPVVWKGWTKQVSFVVDSEWTKRFDGATQLGEKVRYYDVNKNLISETDIVWKIPRIGINKLELSGWPIGAKYIASLLYPDLPDNTKNISEQLLYEIKEPCTNPLMLEWINSSGAFDTWLFQVSQELNKQAGEGIVFESALNDSLDVSQNVLGRIVWESNTEILLLAEKLTIAQLKALHEIKDSVFVYVWLNNTGGEKIRVIVSGDYSTPYNSRDGLHDITIRIRLPKNFNLPNV